MTTPARRPRPNCDRFASATRHRRRAPAGPRRAGRGDAWQAHRAGAWISVMTGAILVGLGLVVVRVAQVQFHPHPTVVAAAQARESVRPRRSVRGDVVDRAGRPIASSRQAFRVFVDPVTASEAGTLDTIAMDLADLLDLDPFDIDRPLHERMLARPESRFVPVTAALPASRVAPLRSALAAGRLRGVGLEPRPDRVLHGGDLAAALVGMTGFDGDGLTGLEHSLEDRLGGDDGSTRFRRASSLRPLWVGEGDHQAARDGSTVRLSIDLAVQAFAVRRLDAAVRTYGAAGGRVVVLDPWTGEILALHDTVQARDPESFDPLIPAHQEWLDTPPAARWMRSVTDPYEPGSTFKPFVWALATEAGFADPSEVLPTPNGPPGLKIRGRRIKDSHYYAEPSTWRETLVRSLNTGMAYVAMRMPEKDLRDGVKAFGFGERTASGIAGETRGLVTPAKRWSYYTQTSVAFGHEISVTMLQMVRAFSAFARDGSMPRLTLLAADRGPGLGPGLGGADGPGRNRAAASRRVLTPETARLVREVMHEVTTEGTGRRARSMRWSSFGKSGTAELYDGNGGIHRDRYTSSYIAGAPMRDPRVVVLCVIDDPDRSKGHYGGAIAGPVVRDVFEMVLEHFGVPEDGGDPTPATAEPAPAAPAPAPPPPDPRARFAVNRGGA